MYKGYSVSKVCIQVQYIDYKYEYKYIAYNYKYKYEYK